MKYPEKWEALVQLRTSFPHIRIHLSVGGWTLSKQFPPMAGSAEGRKTFVDSAVKNLRKWNLDGLDVDWEYPEAGDRANFQSLIRVSATVTFLLRSGTLSLSLTQLSFYRSCAKLLRRTLHLLRNLVFI